MALCRLNNISLFSDIRYCHACCPRAIVSKFGWYWILLIWSWLCVMRKMPSQRLIGAEMKSISRDEGCLCIIFGIISIYFLFARFGCDYDRGSIFQNSRLYFQSIIGVILILAALTFNSWNYASTSFILILTFQSIRLGALHRHRPGFLYDDTEEAIPI